LNVAYRIGSGKLQFVCFVVLYNITDMPLEAQTYMYFMPQNKCTLCNLLSFQL